MSINPNGDTTAITPAPVSRSAVAKRRRDEKARRRERRLKRAVPWLAEKKFSITIARYAKMTVIFDALCDDVRKNGLTDTLDNPRAVVDLLRRFSNGLLAHEKELLLVPGAQPRAHKAADIFETLINATPTDAEIVEPQSSAYAPEIDKPRVQ